MLHQLAKTRTVLVTLCDFLTATDVKLHEDPLQKGFMSSILTENVIRTFSTIFNRCSEGQAVMSKS